MAAHGEVQYRHVSINEEADAEDQESGHVIPPIHERPHSISLIALICIIATMTTIIVVASFKASLVSSTELKELRGLHTMLLQERAVSACLRDTLAARDRGDPTPRAACPPSTADFGTAESAHASTSSVANSVPPPASISSTREWSKALPPNPSVSGTPVAWTRGDFGQKYGVGMNAGMGRPARKILYGAYSNMERTTNDIAICVTGETRGFFALQSPGLNLYQLAKATQATRVVFFIDVSDKAFRCDTSETSDCLSGIGLDALKHNIAYKNALESHFAADDPFSVEVSTSPRDSMPPEAPFSEYNRCRNGTSGTYTSNRNQFESVRHCVRQVKAYQQSARAGKFFDWTFRIRADRVHTGMQPITNYPWNLISVGYVYPIYFYGLDWVHWGAGWLIQSLFEEMSSDEMEVCKGQDDWISHGYGYTDSLWRYKNDIFPEAQQLLWAYDHDVSFNSVEDSFKATFVEAEGGNGGSIPNIGLWKGDSRDYRQFDPANDSGDTALTYQQLETMARKQRGAYDRTTDYQLHLSLLQEVTSATTTTTAVIGGNVAAAAPVGNVSDSDNDIDEGLSSSSSHQPTGRTLTSATTTSSSSTIRSRDLVGVSMLATPPNTADIDSRFKEGLPQGPAANDVAVMVTGFADDDCFFQQQQPGLFIVDAVRQMRPGSAVIFLQLTSRQLHCTGVSTGQCLDTPTGSQLVTLYTRVKNAIMSHVDVTAGEPISVVLPGTVSAMVDFEYGPRSYPDVLGGAWCPDGTIGGHAAWEYRERIRWCERQVFNWEENMVGNRSGRVFEWMAHMDINASPMGLPQLSSLERSSLYLLYSPNAPLRSVTRTTSPPDTTAAAAATLSSASPESWQLRSTLTTLSSGWLGHAMHSEISRNYADKCWSHNLLRTVVDGDDMSDVGAAGVGVDDMVAGTGLELLWTKINSIPLITSTLENK